MYRHLFSFTLPVELCSGRPNCGATQSFDALAQAVTAQALVQVGWPGGECWLSSGPGTPLPCLGNVRLGFSAQDRSEPVQRQFLWACSIVKFLPLPALCRSALRGELLPLAVQPQLETTAMASTNCVVFSWHHQGRVECFFLELSPSRNIHFLRVTKGGRIARGMRSPCLMARACAYAASAVAWELD